MGINSMTTVINGSTHHKATSSRNAPQVWLASRAPLAMYSDGERRGGIAGPTRYDRPQAQQAGHVSSW